MTAARRAAVLLATQAAGRCWAAQTGLYAASGELVRGRRLVVAADPDNADAVLAAADGLLESATAHLDQVWQAAGGAYRLLADYPLHTMRADPQVPAWPVPRPPHAGNNPDPYGES